jgi:hypothetical protein
MAIALPNLVWLLHYLNQPPLQLKKKNPEGNRNKIRKSKREIKIK